jgi:hypothetical protein
VRRHLQPRPALPRRLVPLRHRWQLPPALRLRPRPLLGHRRAVQLVVVLRAVAALARGVAAAAPQVQVPAVVAAPTPRSN